ncbi:N-6 DNA methylase [Streptomyces cavourensis]|uniref:N-6 DNA methylase n=1 Tax=Streptomyces cavourensis TaxID=67258 RepID=UPI0013C32586|nr:N-6 DNA methylase [Streptomyces cavourensis]
MAEEPSTVTATGIARIAGVGRAAVSNWRRRHQDFPRPVAGTSASPAFDLYEVEQWLDRQGKLRSLAPLDRLGRRIETFGAAGRLAEAIALVGLMLLTAAREVPTPRQLKDQARAFTCPQHAEILLSELPEVWSPAQCELLDAVFPVACQEDRVGVFEHLHSRYATTRGTVGLTDTPAAVANLMLDIAGPATVVLDIACGTGTFLRPALEEPTATGAPPRILGQDSRPEHVRIALLRLLLLRQQAGGDRDDAELRLCVADPLLADAFADESVDAVVGSPPHGLQGWSHDRLAFDPRWVYGGLPPRTEPELAWVQNALAHLKPGGRAALLMPPAVAGRPAGRRIRSELVRRGALRAVVALPPTATVGGSNGVHLWALQRPDPAGTPEGGVLFVNGEAAPLNQRTSSREHFEALCGQVAALWLNHRSGRGIPASDSAFARHVSLPELLDEDIDLTPRRHVPHRDSARHTPEALLELPADIEAGLDALRDGMPRLTRVSQPASSDVSTATLGELSRTGALSLHRYSVRTAYLDAPVPERQEPALTSQDVITGRPASGSVPIGPNDEPTARVQAHDILVPAIAKTVVARVATDEQVGVRLGPGVHVVRVDPNLLDPWFVAGALSRPENATKAARRSATGSGALRIDVKRLHLPLLPIDVQCRRSAELRRLARWDAELTRTAEAGHELTRALTRALIDGTLTPSDD